MGSHFLNTNLYKEAVVWDRRSGYSSFEHSTPTIDKMNNYK